MFCQNCGSQIPDGVNVCPNCGNQLRMPGSIQQNDFSQNNQQNYGQPQYDQAQANQYSQQQYGQQQYGQHQFGQNQYYQGQYNQDMYGNYGQRPKSKTGLIIGIIAGLFVLFAVTVVAIFVLVIKPKIDESKERVEGIIAEASEADNDDDDSVKKKDKGEEKESSKKSDDYSDMTADDFSTYDTPKRSDFDFITDDFREELKDKLAIDMELSDFEELKDAEQITDPELIKGGWKAMSLLNVSDGGIDYKMNIFISYDISDDTCTVTMKGVDEESAREAYDQLIKGYGDLLEYNGMGSFDDFLEEIEDKFEGSEPFPAPYEWKDNCLYAYEYAYDLEDGTDPIFRLLFYTLNDGKQYGIFAAEDSGYTFPIVLVRP